MLAPADAIGLLRAAAARPADGLVSRIEGTSMAPTIPHGASIRVVPLPPDGCREGLVVACLSHGGTLFAHRVVRRLRRGGEDWVLTVGDGWHLCDPPVPRTRLVGVVGTWRAEGTWREPAGAPPRRGASSILTRASVALVAATFRIHPQVARHVAGIGLNVGAWLKRFRRFPKASWQ